MELLLPISIAKATPPITHMHKILVVGSCFTEHIGNALAELKFSMLQNPNGILFDPLSVCGSLLSYIENKKYVQSDLFFLNEIWHSWQHHSQFSGTDREGVLQAINASQQRAHAFLKNADWLIVTLGSAFHYRLTGAARATHTGSEGVANCHRAPAAWFQKNLLPIDAIVAALDNAMHRLFGFNAKLRIIFTVSPVRHVRDGVVENNRSKARLLEAVHHLVNKFDRLYYFPAYELVIDVLRDYRFYDTDLVHPNYAATNFVLEHFLKAHASAESLQLVSELKPIITARKHKAKYADTDAHKAFLNRFLKQTNELQVRHPYLNLSDELRHFATEPGQPGMGF